jgi:hypothetical protein
VLEVPNSPAISLSDQPCEIGIATVRRIACARGESLGQSIVESDELRELPFVDTAGEDPARSLAVLPDPVDRLIPEPGSRVALEVDAPFRLERGREDPALGDEEGDEVLVLVVSEVESSCSDSGVAERFNVANVV